MQNKKLYRKKLEKWIIGIIIALCIILIAAGAYFFNMAVVRGQKSFVTNGTVKIKKSDPLYKEKMWYKNAKKQTWYMKSANGKYRLVANYIPNKKSRKTAVVLHGYMSNKENMGAYAQMFHQLGYNVLTPDAEAHGKSQGKYVGYGWLEKTDVRKWINKVIKKNGKDSKVVVFGVSMGGATTMMTSGLKLPKQVKAFVEDCGYTSAKNEIEHEAKSLYNMPAIPRFPLVEILSGITRLKAGYFLGDASSVNQLRKNTHPMLFIHGTSDTFVPTEMVYKNYKATKGPKKLLLVKGAKHAKSIETDHKLYYKTVKNFLNKYVR